MQIIGFVCGAFDLLHPGHLYLLEECRKDCDYLIVGLHTDPKTDRPAKNKPLQTMYERWYQLKKTPWVDEIIPYDTEIDLCNLLATVKIHIRFVGSDYKDKDFTAKYLCETKGIRINYVPREHVWSSSELRARIKK
jgi:glycerol-3-phosphate cytidylyltransferase